MFYPKWLEEELFVSVYEFSCSNAAAMLLRSLSASKVMQLSFLQEQWMRDSEQKRQ